VLASDNTFPIEYSVANFVGLVQNALESAEHMTPNSAQNANPYMRCSYDMLAHDVYSSSTSVAVSGSLGSMPALRERTHRTVNHQSSVISHQSSRITHPCHRVVVFASSLCARRRRAHIRRTLSMPFFTAFDIARGAPTRASTCADTHRIASHLTRIVTRAELHTHASKRGAGYR
tara:strand:+ start:294 stop:818 length:525 start_codon:yes stop_codon:yes gene_type:complete